MNDQLAPAPMSTPHNTLPQSPQEWMKVFRFVLLIAAIDLIGWLVAPGMFAPVARTTWDYLAEAIVILIPVAVLMGLFEVSMPKQLIGQYLGRESGWKGVALAFVFGALPTGPLYVAFPIAAMLLQKGARPLNVMVLLNAWAALKLPQLTVETQFLGPTFMLVRVALTIPATIAIGWLVEKFNRRQVSAPRAP